MKNMIALLPKAKFCFAKSISKKLVIASALVIALATGTQVLAASPSPTPKASPSPSPSPKPKASGTISADPNPCVIPTGQKTCPTTIKWSFQNVSTADVCVSPAGGADQLFASVPVGTHAKNAPWINGANYVFKLRAPANHCKGSLLAAVSVTGQAAPTGGQDGNQDQNQNQQQNNNQQTNVNVSNTNNNNNNINLTMSGNEEVTSGAVPTSTPETGAGTAASLAMLSGAPLGLWLRKIKLGGKATLESNYISSLVRARTSKLA